MSNRNYDVLKFLTLITQIGLTFIFTVLVSIYIGDLLVRLTNVEIFKLIFIIIGVIAGFTGSGKMLVKSIKK